MTLYIFFHLSLGFGQSDQTDYRHVSGRNEKGRDLERGSTWCNVQCDTPIGVATRDVDGDMRVRK